MTAPAETLARRLATFGLPHRESLADRPVDSVEWGALTGRVVRERMEGMLAAAVHAGGLPVSESQLAELTRLARSRARADLRLERETLTVSALLQDEGVSHRVIKGPAWAHTAYPDPMMRGFGDVDVLVEPSRWYDAIEILQRSGSERVLPELRPGFDGRFGKDATLKALSGSEIDLHRTLVLGPYGYWLDCEELMARPPGRIEVGRVSLPILDTQATFLHACYNAALADDPPRLMALRDVAQMALAADVSPEQVLDLARRWRGTSVIRRAMLLVTRHLGVDLSATPVGCLFQSSIPAWDRLLLTSYRGPARGYTSQLAGVAAVPGIRTRGAYLAALARPQKSYLQARGYGAIGYVRHVVGKLGRRRPR